MKLSIVIPAHNEEGCIEKTCSDIVTSLDAASIPFELVVVNDHSTDATSKILARMKQTFAQLETVDNNYPNGFGFALQSGLEVYSGDAVAIVMADASDDPKDIVKFYGKLCQGYDCVFGSRFIRGGAIYDYPKFKLFVNRLANFFISVVFGMKYNDTANAFKMFRRETVEGLKPFLSHHFNLTVELPLKAITRGYTYAVLPNSWTNRKTGESKLKIKEMGSRYLFIVLYCLIEKWLSLGDYKKEGRSIS